MENHPIPQDVTGFQFKLIGNMTVKQFAYLATGIVFSWILFQLPISILIKFPFCAFSAILGIALAYFPVSGRPMDVMIGNYIKALLRPTQFVYEKQGGQIYFPNGTPPTTVNQVAQSQGFTPFPKDKLKAYLASTNAAPKNMVDEKEKSFLQSVSGLAAIQIPRQQNTTLSSSAQPANPTQQESLSKQQEIAPQPVNAPQPALQAAPQIKQAPPAMRSLSRDIGTPNIPEFPNLITGITKDARGNALSNILIEVKDKDGNPVRAFKTNELGRFASATPLISGTYAIEFEDPKGQNKFENISINATGQVILPIEAISVDTREELRRSLFESNGKTN